MADHGFSILLEPIWREWDEPVFRLVEGVHRRLPKSIPPVTLHGRGLDPVREGFGAQYQLTMNGLLFDGRYRAAYFVIQIRPQRQAPPRALRGPEAVARLVWRVDTIPILQPTSPTAEIERFDQRGHEIPIAEPERLTRLFETEIFEGAAAFFRQVLTGSRPGHDPS